MLGHDWQPAQATVIATRPLGNWSHGVGAYGGDITPHEYVVDVRPPGEPMFRATFHEPLMHGRYRHAQKGDVVPAHCRAGRAGVRPRRGNADHPAPLVTACPTRTGQVAREVASRL